MSAIDPIYTVYSENHIYVQHSGKLTEIVRYRWEPIVLAHTFAAAERVAKALSRSDGKRYYVGAYGKEPDDSFYEPVPLPRVLP